jgi:hypothetical protein
MIKTRRALLSVMIAVFATCSVSGHHSVRMKYDSSTTVSLSGVITRVELVNPHVRIELSEKETGDDSKTWLIEMAAPRTLLQRKFDMRLLDFGRPVTIEAWLAKDGQNLASGRTLVTSEGQRWDIHDIWR